MVTPSSLTITSSYVSNSLSNELGTPSLSSSKKEFRIQQIEVLDDVREKLANSLFLRWDYQFIDKEKVKSLENLFGKYKGKKQIIFELLDQKTKSYVTLNSRKFRSNISNDLITKLSQFEGFLGYSINKSFMNHYVEKEINDI